MTNQPFVNNALSLVAPNNEVSIIPAPQAPRWVQAQTNRALAPATAQMQAIEQAFTAAMDHVVQLYGYGEYKTFTATMGAEVFKRGVETVMGGALPLQDQIAFDQRKVLMLTTVHVLQQAAALQIVQGAAHVPQVVGTRPTLAQAFIDGQPTGIAWLDDLLDGLAGRR
jgi:hypothetical protein